MPRLYEGEHAYILQNADNRIVFVIPYEGRFSLIGTTDIPFEGDPAAVAITPEETAYLLRGGEPLPRASRSRRRTSSGPIPACARSTTTASGNPSAVTRDYVFDVEARARRGRRCCRCSAARSRPTAGSPSTRWRSSAASSRPPRPWTAGAPLPGGDMPGADFDRFLADFRRERPWLPPELARRLARAYGTRVARLLGAAGAMADLGEDLGAGLTEREVAYLVEAGVGPQRRRHPVAALEARPAWRRGAESPPRGMARGRRRGPRRDAGGGRRVRLKAILFDLDGTLVDSAGDLRDALNALLAEEGLAPLDLQAVKGMVGDGVAKLVERGLTARGAGLDRLPARVARFMELYEPNAARLTRPYPLVAETLESLRQRGLRLAVVTNKPHAATMRILEALDLARFFDAVVGGDTLSRRKPDPAPLLHAMRALDAAPAETLMVGDNHHDVAAARAAGVPVAVVAYGYGGRPAAELGADRVLDSFAALRRLVDGPQVPR